ncbi:MAG: hypothetical protein GQ522_03395 [Deltaproteobacteria bacterium]|nr:hypothetical protein [Deltaproteobacteria bacterium]
MRPSCSTTETVCHGTSAFLTLKAPLFPDHIFPGTPATHISMGCGDRCPQVRAKERREWAIPDPGVMPLDEFRVLRDLIEGKAKELLANLLQPPGSGRQG